MAKSPPRRTAAQEPSSTSRAQRSPDEPPFPVHLPDPPQKRPWLLALGVGLLIAWLLALASMAFMARKPGRTPDAAPNSANGDGT
ncbi:MAG: hypothetical protein AB7O62_19425 [Pirellulales bacterium]